MPSYLPHADVESSPWKNGEESTDLVSSTNTTEGNM